VWSLVGPGAFALAARTSRRLEPGYVPRDQPISALAAFGTRSSRVMVPGFFGLAAGTVAFARQLRGARSAPAPVPVLLTILGLAVGGAGVARCSDRTCPTRGLPGGENCKPTDDAHVAFAMVAFGLWVGVPIVAARRATDASERYRRWSRRLGLATLASLVVGSMFARSPSQRWSGWGQRVTLVSAFAWYPLAAANA
jgi:hypothetical protein